ncbi:MAG TPA: asparagine synthetase B, partial [Ktedonobacterales bacterium]|nr:asparagine synthetase B [Ktedonobacterales bacterium]
MCGIAGFINRDTAHPADAGLLRSMNDAIAHRGPDDEGFHLEGPVALGMRRLSIIDLKTGHQPLSNEDGTIWIVFNGEVYNFGALRRELEQGGARFRGESDTEVILAAFERWGIEDAVRRFVGMFALAVWDTERRE